MLEYYDKTVYDKSVAAFQSANKKSMSAASRFFRGLTLQEQQAQAGQKGVDPMRLYIDKTDVRKETLQAVGSMGLKTAKDLAELFPDNLKLYPERFNSKGVDKYQHLGTTIVGKFKIPNDDGTYSAGVIVASNFRPSEIQTDANGYPQLIAPPQYDKKINETVYAAIVAKIEPDGKIGKTDRSKGRNGVAFALTDLNKVADACCRLAKVPNKATEQALKRQKEAVKARQQQTLDRRNTAAIKPYTPSGMALGM